MSAPLLSVSGLSKRYGGARPVAALDGVSFTVAAGETLALVGPSGSGKSTAARCILQLVEPDAGAVLFEGSDLRTLRGAALRDIRKHLQVVFQEPMAAFNPRSTVGRLIGDPLRIHGLADAAARPARVAELLERVGLPAAFATRRPHELSGGQRQRVAIARSIATRPSLVVLDEAVSALDVSVRADILKLLSALQAEDGMAYLFITHDLGVVRAVAHRVAVMDAGRIVEEGLAESVIARPESRTARALVAAAPKLKTIENEEKTP